MCLVNATDRPVLSTPGYICEITWSTLSLYIPFQTSTGHGVDGGLVTVKECGRKPLFTRHFGEGELDGVVRLSVHDHMVVFHPNRPESGRLVTWICINGIYRMKSRGTVDIRLGK